MDESLASERMIATLSTVFGVLATVLAILGLYGVTAYTVTRRACEIGIRRAPAPGPGGTPVRFGASAQAPCRPSRPSSRRSQAWAETLGQMQRDHQTYQAPTNALQEAAEEQGVIAVREGDDRNAQHKGGASENHERLAPRPIRQQQPPSDGWRPAFAGRTLRVPNPANFFERRLGLP